VFDRDFVVRIHQLRNEPFTGAIQLRLHTSRLRTITVSCLERLSLHQSALPPQTARDRRREAASKTETNHKIPEISLMDDLNLCNL
jgi:hypothetical protein